MAFTSFLPSTTPKGEHIRHQSNHRHCKRKKKPSQIPPPAPPPHATRTPAPSSWEQFKSLLSCRIAAALSQVHNPSSSCKLGGRSSCGSSICAFRDVVHGNTRVVHRPDTDHCNASDSGTIDTVPLTRPARHRHPPAAVVSSRSHSKGGMQLRKFSGCYECHAISAEPASRTYPRPRTLCACPECGEVFTKSEDLWLHQIIRHAVSELGPEDSGRNIVEIIFKSSWQKKDHPICKIERILKVHHTQRILGRFEDYRDAVKARALLHLHSAAAASGGLRHHPTNKKNPRCAADGNELLRFHCTTLACSLGARGSTALCSSATSPAVALCGVCTIIRHGFGRAHHPHGVLTTASSGRAHDRGPPLSAAAVGGVGGLRAMLVCRVIAGRIRLPGDGDLAGEDGYDSVAGGPGFGVGASFTTLEELFVANPRAILPCFVVIYGALD